MVQLRLGNRKTSNFAKLFEFDNICNICWFGDWLLQKFLHTTKCANFNKKWGNYFKMGLNMRSYNFTEKIMAKKTILKLKTYCFSDTKKQIVFSVGKNLYTYGDFSTRPLIFWPKFEKRVSIKTHINNLFRHFRNIVHAHITYTPKYQVHMIKRQCNMLKIKKQHVKKKVCVGGDFPQKNLWSKSD